MKKALALFGVVSLHMVLPILGGVILGNYIYSRTGSGMMLIFFILAGVMSGFISIYKLLRKGFKL